MKKKVLITGGNSFLARSFKPFLQDRYELVCLNRQQLNLNNVDSVQKCLQAGVFDVVIHTATYDAAPKDSPNDPKLVLENNLRMFFNLARNRQYFGKMFYFGSGAEFGRENWSESMSESQFDQYVPKDQYGYSKYLMTQYTLTTDNIFNLRLFGVFGELDDWRYRFLSNVCAHAVLDDIVSIHQNSKVDFLYIQDLAQILLWFIDNESKYQVYNVSRGKTYEFTELAETIQRLNAKPLKIAIENQQINKKYGGNNSRLLDEFKQLKFTPMSESLSNMLNWFETHKSEIDVNQFHF